MNCPELALLHGHLLSVCELRQCDLLTCCGTLLSFDTVAAILFPAAVHICEVFNAEVVKPVCIRTVCSLRCCC